MPVQRQLVPVPFQGGIDTKSDPRQVAMGSLVDLQNAVFGETGALKKRYGYSQSVPALSSGAVAIATFEDELLAFDGLEAWSLAKSTNSWSSRGLVDSTIVGGTQVIRTSAAQQLNPDVAIAGGVELYVWEDSRGGIRCATLDAATGAYYLSDTVVDAGGSLPRALVYGSEFLILYYDGIATIKAVQIAPSSPTVVGSSSSLVTDGHASLAYDACVVGAGGTTLVLAYLAGSAPSVSIKLALFSGAWSAGATAVVATGSAALSGAGPSVIGVAPDSSSPAQSLCVVWATGAALGGAVYPVALGSPVMASTVMSGGPIVPVTTLTLINTGGALGTTAWFVWWATAGATASDQVTWIGLLDDSAPSYAAQGVYLRSVGIASKPWLQSFAGNTFACLVLTHESPLQSTYFVSRTDSLGVLASVFAKAQPDTGGGLRTNGMVSSAVQISSVVTVAGLSKGKSETEAGTLFSLLGVASLVFDFAHPDRFLDAVQSRNLLMGGGIVQTYDGVSFVEQGMHLDPEGVAAVAAGSDGSLGTGTYQYVVVYEWTDNRGQRQLSGGSIPLSVSVTATNHVALTIPTLRITKKSSLALLPRADVSIAIYRTAANGLLFNRCSSVLAPLLNNISADSVSFVDKASDADIASGELLYTTGNVLDNTAPPPASIVCPFQGRVCLSGLEDPHLIWFSKNKFDNTNYNTIPVEFSSALTIGVDARGGSITALGLLDDKLVVFKESSIFVVSGDGPDDTGGGSTFADPELVASDVGCATPNSVVVTPQGLMFASAKGIYLLDRSVTLSYVGGPVEAYNDLSITSATLHPTANEVLFTLSATAPSGAQVLVYDYLYSQWGTWTQHDNVIDADIFEDVFVWISSSGQLNVQTPGVYLDGSNGIPLMWQTPPISFAGLSGFQRAFRVFVLGSWVSAHTLTVAVTIDGDTDTDTFASIAPLATDPEYNYRVDFVSQRCTTVQVQVTENPQTPFGASATFSGLTFEVGVLPGGNRVPQAQIVGAS